MLSEEQIFMVLGELSNPLEKVIIEGGEELEIIDMSTTACMIIEAVLNSSKQAIVIAVNLCSTVNKLMDPEALIINAFESRSNLIQLHSLIKKGLEMQADKAFEPIAKCQQVEVIKP